MSSTVDALGAAEANKMTKNATCPSPTVIYPSLPDLARLSLNNATTTPLPPSPAPPSRRASSIDTPHSPRALAPIQPAQTNQIIEGARIPPASAALRRTTSSTSLKSSRSSTPTLLKKASISSLKGSGLGTPPRSPISSRRASSNFGLSQGASPRSMLAPAMEEPPSKPERTPTSIAKEVFEKELQHHSEEGTSEPDIVVVLHDACYGHRFSRPRTSKAGLATIVERPERVTAIVQGLSMAYVRLGGRHADGAHPLCPNMPISPIPFKFEKSTRSLPLDSPAVTQVHGLAWMTELKTMCQTAETRLAQDGKELVRPITAAADGKIQNKPKLHEGDLYLSPESLNALQGALGGVCDAVDAVFKSTGPRRAFACIRPPGHHCSNDHPSGFCWINNIHVGIAHAMQNHGLTHAAIIDFDLHHGDGSQAITWAHNSRINSLHKNASPSKRCPIGYFSLHDINSYPCEYGDAEKVLGASMCIESAHGQTIWNVHLQTWQTEDEFWELYESRYLVLIQKMRYFLRRQVEVIQSLRPNVHSRAAGKSQEAPVPKAAIFISAGFDASEWEGVGMQRHKVNVPTTFYARFTRDIAALADEAGLGVNGRIISVLEGGYSAKALMSGVFSHLCGFMKESSVRANGDFTDQMSGLSVVPSSPAPPKPGLASQVDYSWWSPARLEEFDELLKPMPPPTAPGPKKNRTINPSYITPTQASAAKALPARRTLSGTYTQQIAASASPPRAPTPPPPPVGWAVAAHELSKLLIPSDRQTTSCKPEELAAPRQRKVRQSEIGVVKIEDSGASTTNGTIPNATAESKRTGLRERKPKPLYQSEDEEKPKKARAPSRTSRRTTIGVTKSTVIKDEMPEALLLPAMPTQLPSSVPQTAVDPIGTTAATLSSVPLVNIPQFDGPSHLNILQRPPPLQRPSSEGQVPRQSGNEAADTGPEERVETSQVGERVNSIDTIANGMKKMSIKLNVPSKEEHDMREREKEKARHSLA